MKRTLVVLLCAAAMTSCLGSQKALSTPVESLAEKPGPTAGPTRILMEEESPFGKVFVVEEDGLRVLRFDRPDGDNQSELRVGNPNDVPMECIRLAAVALAHMETPRRVLMIGLGGGNFGTLLWNTIDAIEIDAVEINPVVVRAAREFFYLPTDPSYRVHVGDGREFVQESDARFDLIFIDAYNGDDIPTHLAKRDFFSLVKTRLAPEGVAVLNVAVPDEKEAALVGVFTSVFPDTVCYRARKDDNLILVGTCGPSLEAGEVHMRAGKLTSELAIPFDLVEEADKRTECEK